MTDKQLSIMKSMELQYGAENVSCEHLDNDSVMLKVVLPNGIIHREFISGYNYTVKTNNIIPNEYVIVYRTPENVEKTLTSNNIENDIHQLHQINCKIVSMSILKSGKDSISKAETRSFDAKVTTGTDE